MNTKVDDYIVLHSKWNKELILLRKILLDLSLKEDIKWGIPAYIHKGKNILGLVAFKDYCGIWFHHGVFLIDKSKILINAQKNKTKGLRQMRFSSFDEIEPQLVKQYVLEAIENSEAGKEIKPTRNVKPVVIPDEILQEFSKNKELKKKFFQFSKAKQREFSQYVLSAKKEVTKNKRLLKVLSLIEIEEGLNDKYRNK